MMQITNGVVDTDPYAEIVEHHFHGREHWCGKSADQSGNNWGTDTLTAYQCVSGNGVYGADANDEAKVLGSADTPVVAGMIRFDFHRITFVELDEDVVYKFRVVWGTGTMAAAIEAGQTSEFMAINATAGSKAGGAPIETMMPRVAIGTQVWIQCKCGVDDATADFYVGFHEYDE